MKWRDIGGKFYPHDIAEMRTWKVGDPCPECGRAMRVEPEDEMVAACIGCDTLYESEQVVTPNPAPSAPAK